MSLPNVEAVTEALDWVRKYDLPPNSQWRTIREAARAYVNAVEFDAPHTVDVPGHFLLIKVRTNESA